MAGEIEKTCNKVAVIYESELIATSTTEDALKISSVNGGLFSKCC